MLKSTAYSIAPPLTYIFNLSLQSGVLPTDWRLSHIIVHIQKCKPPSSSPTDYRHIYLSPSYYTIKVLEHHTSISLIFVSVTISFPIHSLVSLWLLYCFCSSLCYTIGLVTRLDSHSSVCAVFFGCLILSLISFFLSHFPPLVPLLTSSFGFVIT